MCSPQPEGAPCTIPEKILLVTPIAGQRKAMRSENAPEETMSRLRGHAWQRAGSTYIRLPPRPHSTDSAAPA